MANVSERVDFFALPGSLPAGVSPEIALIADTPSRELTAFVEDAIHEAAMAPLNEAERDHDADRYQRVYKRAQDRSGTADIDNNPAVAFAAELISESAPNFIPPTTDELERNKALAVSIQKERSRLARPYRMALAIGGLAVGLGTVFGATHSASAEHTTKAMATFEAQDAHSADTIAAGIYDGLGATMGGGAGLLVGAAAKNGFARRSAMRHVKKARKG